ncbi:MAG: DUF3488 and DUF4129 domain-containing transglutaminase family protein [Synechococcales bacterium]|nr:DUF3488 and DUF4129 domain-containing transglutaminase family protein [Synechococcales bacterium]
MTPIHAPRRSRPSLKTLWQQQFDAPAQEDVEDSLALRVFVQALVTVGIIAIDVSSADLTGIQGTSLWAVPVSIVGASWSWFRRRSRNIPVKFCIAIAMLLALATFLMRILAERNDTRLALAHLLIQLQVFHSFDLPRRKDLGYSMVIGLILIGVAATISQTFTFAPVLLAFLAIALPALTLDYRSRLGIQPRGMRLTKIGFSLRQMGAVLGVTLALGLVIFAFLPRFQGYQIRSFPVSAPIEFDGQFDGSTITNPGYVNEGSEGSGGEASDFGTNQGEGGEASEPGTVDTNSYYGFSSRMNQNLRGEMVPQVVMRVRSQAEGFWRVLAFDRYTGQGWEISRNTEEDIDILDRPRWTMRFFIPLSPTLNRTREVIQTYTVTAELPNLIPSLYEPKHLYFPTEQVAIDPEGSLRSPLNLTDGLTYTVVSQVPYRDRTRLREASIDYPEAVRRHYLQVPEAIAPRLQETTQAILARSANPLTDPYEQALYLTQYLKQNYTIQPDLPFLDPDDDLVESFLFDYAGGYPDHFSTALTLMLRSIGIPARLVAGFGAGEFNPFTGFYVVRNTDAYAMTEVYFGQYGWFAFDPIPGHEALPPTIRESDTFGVLRQFWNWIAGWLPSPVAGFLNGLFDAIASGASRAIAFITSLFSRGWIGGLVGLALLTGVGFLGWLGLMGWRALRYRLWLNQLPPMEAAYQQMVRWLETEGFRKSAAQTPLEYARTVSKHHSPSKADLIEEISHTYVQWRYGDRTPDLGKVRDRLKALKTNPVEQRSGK